jgi:hypothetical protein
VKLSVAAVILLLFAMVLGCYVYLSVGDWRSPVKSPEVAQSMQLLPLRDGDAIRRMQIQNASKNLNVTLEYDQNHWMMISPVRYPADEMLSEGFVTALKLSTKARRLMPEKGWDEYGLLKPAIKVGIETQKDPKKRFLYLGDVAPTGNFIYARWENESEYFLLNADLRKVFDQTVYALRMKKVFRMPLKDITKVTLVNSSGTWELSKIDEGWYWVEPLAILGDEVEKRDLDFIFSELERFHIKDFLDSSKKTKSELGFTSMSPFLRINNQKAETETLRLGGELPARDAFYGMRDGEPTLFLVSRGNFENFFRELEGVTRSHLSHRTARVTAA